ncbi:MAG TPA: hypothetical protein VFK02_05710 [Kofleriaceae bacterium]|nr:hypothetical protein [Kofleriaceae bacterium]
MRLPERDLAEVILELAAPLLERLGPAPSIEDARSAIDLAVAFWNASVHASKLWEYPRVKELNELRKRMSGRQATQDDATLFDLLMECRRSHWLDPRLVERWTYDTDDAGARHLVCSVDARHAEGTITAIAAKHRSETASTGGADPGRVRASASRVDRCRVH